MINSVTLKKFRGFSDTTVPLSKVTMLTGTNGVGKTSVLEGLYCLFSETRLDVSPLMRYNRTLGTMTNQFNGVHARQGYNYRLFWEECPIFGESSCHVSAKSDDGETWQWTYTKAIMLDLDMEMLKDARSMGVVIDSSTDIALFRWELDRPTAVAVDRGKLGAQILSPDCGLYLVPQRNQIAAICKYLDFASIKAIPLELPYQTAKKLTEALKIINPRITDVRISKAENGLSVILDDDKETTLGTIGNGAVTWASTLIAIFELIEQFKIDQRYYTPIFILIDEIGTGIHYSVMNDIWKYIRDFIAKYPDIQFVTTSHSDDCVRAFCETFAEEKNTASVVRLHKAVDNEIVPTLYDASRFDAVISGEWEVRG